MNQLSNLSRVMEAESHIKNGANLKGHTSRDIFFKRVLLSAVCFITLSCACFAQDIIITKDAKKINVKVTEVNEDNVRYKKIDNLGGPTYTLSKGNIASILYQNGQVDTFETAAVAPAPETAKSSAIEALDAKTLEQVLAEALKKVSDFESISAELMLVEGMNEFFYVWLKTAEGKKTIGLSSWYLNSNAEQKFRELTGLSYAELTLLVKECVKLGILKLGIYSLNFSRYPLDVLSDKRKLKTFLDTFNKPEELRAAFELSLAEIEKSEVMTIPEYYRCSLALETMQKFVKTRRASTWKECVNLFEEQLHRWRIEMNSEESVRLQRDMLQYSRATARNTRATAIFSGLIWLGL